jgi:hypothetical protein
MFPKALFGFAAGGAGLAALGAHANAQQTIIQDIFTSGSQYGAALGAQGANSKGLDLVPTNLPGGPWQHITGAFYGAQEFSGKMNGAIGNGDQSSPTDFATFNTAAVGIALGSYNTGILHVTAGECYMRKAGQVLPASGQYILAGFSSKLNSASNYGPDPMSTFTGIAVTSTSGAIQEYINGSAVAKPVAFVGTYSAYTETILSYTINTATGEISEVSFGNSTASYSFPTPPSFSSSYTANLEIGGSGGGGQAFATISSIILTSDAPAKSSPDEKDAPASAH